MKYNPTIKTENPPKVPLSPNITIYKPQIISDWGVNTQALTMFTYYKDTNFEKKNYGNLQHFENSKTVPRIKTKIHETACGTKYLLAKPTS